MKRIMTSLLIRATPAAVFKVLTDIDEYAQWCSTLIGMTHIAGSSDKIKVTYKDPLNGKFSNFNAKIVGLRANKLWALQADNWTGWFYTYRMICDLSQAGPHETRLVHKVEIGGLLPLFFGEGILNRTVPHAEKFARELALRSEAIATRQ